VLHAVGIWLVNAHLDLAEWSLGEGWVLRVAWGLLVGVGVEQAIIGPVGGRETEGGITIGLQDQLPGLGNLPWRQGGGVLWLPHANRLAVVGTRPVVAVAIVPSHAVLVSWCLPQVQVAVGSVVAIRLIVACGTEPPRRVVGGVPSALGSHARVHGMPGASTAAVLWSSDIDDPVWSSERSGRCNERLPVLTTPWSEELGASWARVLVLGLVDSQAVLALQQVGGTVLAIQLDLLAAASRWTSWLWLSGELHTLAVVTF